MGRKVVYPVFCSGDDHRLTVSVEGKTVPMEEFVRTHTPIEISSLTPLSGEAAAQSFIALMIAEEKEQIKPTFGR